jgi:hypothetical protein
MHSAEQIPLLITNVGYLWIVAGGGISPADGQLSMHASTRIPCRTRSAA